MRYLYTFIFYLLLPFIFLRLLWRGIRNPDYLKRWNERLGFFIPPSSFGGIWVHAVSVGEAMAAIPLIKALQSQYPNELITVTTTTPTASALIQKQFNTTVFHIYSPLDFPGAIQRFLQHIRPKLCIIMETELWPNLYYYCHTQNIPIFIANGRLSEKSFISYKKIRPFVKSILAKVSKLAAQSTKDAERFELLGLAHEKIHITGNLKFDCPLPENLEQDASDLRKHWGKSRLVWIAASTHEGEEEQVLEAFKPIKAKIPQSLLVIVPRHPERFYTVADLCQKQAYNVAFYSEHPHYPNDTDIIIGDVMGKLLLFYAASDVAYVGGSLVPHGGQNLLEPASVGIIPIIGPHYFNFSHIHSLLAEQGAVITVQNSQELAKEVLTLFDNPEKRKALGEKAKQVVEKNKGSLARHMTDIQEFINV